jgi:hypothetical protein
MSLKTAQKVIVPQKKIMSCIFLNSGTLIVIMYLLFLWRGRNDFEAGNIHYKAKGHC